MSDEAIAIYGAKGFAREVAWLASELKGDQAYELLGFIDDAAEPGSTLWASRVYRLEDLLSRGADFRVSVAIGDPRTRATVVALCKRAGLRFATLVHESVRMSGTVHLGEGCIVCAGSILTVDIHIEEQVHINLDCTIGHDVRVGAYTTLTPGVHVSGNVDIGRGVYLGTGANIINGAYGAPLRIGAGSIIAAGACLTEDAEPNSLYAGVPARKKKDLSE
jgi:sugar O-acyltransferase (sialic acid O-acetyltransferase NeuD family)